MPIRCLADGVSLTVRSHRRDVFGVGFPPALTASSWHDRGVSENEPLLRHAASWAGQRNRVCDTDLLETALELRSVHDGLAPNHWPAGSVEELMLHRWPAHGNGIPDVDSLAASLDTFVRFLRVTGRMASGSADPRALAREAHRAAPKMSAACAEATSFGPVKSLLSFGREAGFAVDGAESLEELQSTLGQVMEAWNALPDHERHSRMPFDADFAGSEPPGGLGGLTGFDAQGGRGGRSPDPFDAMIQRGDPVRAADQARRSPFVQSCLRLAEWVGHRAEVTGTGVLRPAEAKRAYSELELWRWQQEVEVITYGHSDEFSQEFRWRRSGDALPLERLWFAVESAELVDLGRTVARSSNVVPQRDDEWVGLAIALLLPLWLILEGAYNRSAVPVLAVLGGCLLGGSITRAQVRTQWDAHPSNLWRSRQIWQEMPEQSERLSERELSLSLHFFSDTGIWVLDDETFQLTDLGRDFASVIFAYLDARGDASD